MSEIHCKKSAKSMSVKKWFRIYNFHIKIRNFSTMKIQGMSIPGSSRRSIPDAIPKIATKSADWNWWVEAVARKLVVCATLDSSIMMEVLSVQGFRKTIYGGAWPLPNKMKFAVKWPGLGTNIWKSSRLMHTYLDIFQRKQSKWCESFEAGLQSGRW